MSQCRKFTPNIFHKTKCSNCFRQKEEHSAEALECNRASRSIARSGYLFVAPDWDFSVPLNRTKRWQRRWFVLYDDGELNYSVDEHPDTIPQGSVDMSKVLEVTGAEQITGHPHSLALTSPDRVTFVKAASREDARWWAELLAVFPRRHKRNATFPGGRASPSLPQLGRSASPQPPRPRHLSCTNVVGASPRVNFETPPLKEERESPPKDESNSANITTNTNIGTVRPGWVPEPTNNLPIIENSIRNDYLISSGSPPTRDKLRCDDKARARRDWRNERLRDIATALTDRSPESSLALPAESLLHLKKGWLWLKNNNNEFVRRWVVLSGPTLNIYHDQDEQSAPEIIVELSTVINYNEVATDTKYGFEIKTTDLSLILSAVTSGIRSNWLQALKKAAPIIAPSSSSPPPPPTTQSPPPLTQLSEIVTTPPLSKSLSLLSSDEEYRTASEGCGGLGGRRGSSDDWSELPPSPPLNRNNLSLNRVKDRVRVRTRLPRNQSRQSTLDSTSTDEIDCVKCTEFHNKPNNNNNNNNELNNELNKQNLEINDLQKQLSKALDEVRCLEEEIARLKKFQAEAVIQEKKTKEIMLAYERTEHELNQRNAQIETKFIKEQKCLQRKLYEAEEKTRITEEKYNQLMKELQNKQRIIQNLQDELTKCNEKLQLNHNENVELLKRIDELERNSSTKSGINVDTFTDLINIDLDMDIVELNQNELQEYCLDLRGRFERAILEIRCIKRELRESYNKSDHLELDNYNLQNNIELVKQQNKSEIDLLVSRLEHLTNKLNITEKQLRSKSKDKRRSLSLKGRESFSLNKEVEDKVTELEAKILALERNNRTKRNKYKRERSSERNSPIDDRSLRRLRRKSLDSATTSSESLKLLMRLNSLETKVTNVGGGSTESLNQSIDEQPAKQKIKECLCQINNLKTNITKQCSIQLNLERLTNLEQNLNELNHLLDLDNDEMNAVNSSVNTVVKQLQNLLMEKLISLSERKRSLKANNKLDKLAKLQILAEKIAYENILINRIQEALTSPMTGETTCERLIVKEMEETNHLIVSLHNKLQGIQQVKQLPQCKTGVDYLTKILTKYLITTTTGFINYKNLIKIQGPTLDYLINEQKKIDRLLINYKSIKLPQLAEALATETMALSTDKTCRLRLLNDDTINDFSLTARDIVNAELIQSEINHVLIRASQIYQNNLDYDHNYFFSFFAAERATLELWSDAVNDCLQDEINKSINELNEYYQNHLNKLQRQNWRRRLESERNNKLSNSLLQEYADIIAHKSLIDARIQVLSGKFINEINNVNNNSNNSSDSDEFIKNWLINDKLLDCFDNNNYLVQINQSLETEFLTMLDRFSKDCYSIIGQSEQLEQIFGYLNDLSNEIVELQKQTNLPVSCDSSDVVIVRNWADVCQQCKLLRDKLEEIRHTIGRNSPRALTKSQSFKMLESLEEHRPVHLGAEYLTQVENLRASYRCALASCKERHQIADLEQLQILCERVLVAMEQWHRRTIHELREQHQLELEAMRREKEQALAEETQATLAALDAMRKAHEAEVQREVAKFKQEWARQQRDDLLELSERLSVKCLEAAALEEQLTHAQQHILQLERNPQLSPMQN